MAIPPIQPQTQTEKPLTTNQKPSANFGKSYTFKLRQHITGNFRGLWELTKIDRLGKVEKMLADADGLSFCIEHIQGELEADGY